MSETKKLESLVKKCNSIEELEKCLKKQNFIENVSVSNYLIKTAPPMKELLVVMKMPDGSKKTKVVDVKVYPEKRIELAGIHDK